MADVEVWLGEVAGALDVTLEDVLPEATQDELLTLTGDIAHNVVRLAVPLSSYLIGVAVGRGASAEEAIRLVGGLLPAAEGSGRVSRGSGTWSGCTGPCRRRGSSPASPRRRALSGRRHHGTRRR